MWLTPTDIKYGRVFEDFVVTKNMGTCCDYYGYTCSCTQYEKGNDPHYKTLCICGHGKSQHNARKPKQLGQSQKEAAAEVFEEWKKVLNHPRSLMDDKRLRRIGKLLNQGFSVEDLKKAPHGVKKSPWHMGENPTKTIYDKIDIVFRDADQVEMFIELSKQKTAPRVPAISACLFCDTFAADKTKAPCRFHQVELFKTYQAEKRNGKKDI